MKATYSENENNISIVENYYKALLSKDYDTMSNFLHEDIILISPLTVVKGKSDVVTAAKNFSAILDDIEYQTKFSNENQVMIAYDLTFSSLNLVLHAATLVHLSENKIIKSELFYDARPFEKEKNRIFSK